MDATIPQNNAVRLIAGLLSGTFFVAFAWGRDRPCRKDRDGGEVCWQLARQALQKRHYVVRFGVAQPHPELHPRHDADGLRKRRHRAVVKVGRGHRDIAQAGNTENIEVVGILGDIGASIVDGLAARCFPIGLNNTEFSVHSAANEDTVVAPCTAGIDEGIEAAASFGRQYLDVASEVAIKRRWRYQGSRNLDPLRGDQMRWANLRSRSQRPRPTAATMASSTVPAQEAAT